MDRGGPAGSPLISSSEPAPPVVAVRDFRVQTLRHAFLELQRTLPSVPPDTKLSKLDVLLLATTYIAHLTRSLQDDAEAPADPGLGALRGDGYLHPVKKWPMRSRLYIGATGQFLKHPVSGEKTNHDNIPTDSQP
ncbi:PREDICTED: transcription factor 24 [Bison bison bison]|uniref:Transcription factor 24 n=1 Tax=Bison bison bison TaxID=43346 RepID=A0A6P3HW38_BISBB|nr:PREDICTED: transcription factor 24 [Bison bison bison]